VNLTLFLQLGQGNAMPTILYLDFPSDTPPDEFEKIVRDGMGLQWQTKSLQLQGVSGQAQHGVDIYGKDDLGRPTAIQCKRYKSKLKLTTIEAEVKRAEGFQAEGDLSCLYIATTAPRDNKLQRDVRVISAKRVGLGKFAVGLLYWDDILSGLLRDHEVLTSHFPHAKLPGSEAAPDDDDTKATALVLGYYGRFLWHYIEIGFNEFGWLANQDPEEIRTLIRMVRAGAAITKGDVKAELIKWTNGLEKMIFPAKAKDRAKVDWEEVKLVAKRVEDRVKYLPDMHANKTEARLIDFGMALGHINWHDGKFKKTDADNVTRKFRKLIPSAVLPLQETLGRLQGRNCYTAGPVLMTLADRELKWPTESDGD
jgi:hypothetical protein